jgi:hypothetical protein
MMKKLLMLVTVALVCSTSFAAAKWKDGYIKRYDRYKKIYDTSVASLEKALPKQKVENIKQIVTKRVEYGQDILITLEGFKKAAELEDKVMADCYWQIITLKIQKYNLLATENTLAWWKRSYVSKGKRDKVNPKKYDDVVKSLQAIDDSYTASIGVLDKCITELEKSVNPPAPKK